MFNTLIFADLLYYVLNAYICLLLQIERKQYNIVNIYTLPVMYKETGSSFWQNTNSNSM